VPSVRGSTRTACRPAQAPRALVLSAREIQILVQLPTPRLYRTTFSKIRSADVTSNMAPKPHTLGDGSIYMYEASSHVDLSHVRSGPRDHTSTWGSYKWERFDRRVRCGHPVHSAAGTEHILNRNTLALSTESFGLVDEACVSGYPEWKSSFQGENGQTTKQVVVGNVDLETIKSRRWVEVPGGNVPEFFCALDKDEHPISGTVTTVWARIGRSSGLPEAYACEEHVNERMSSTSS
jgi:hypothetical protein